MTDWLGLAATRRALNQPDQALAAVDGALTREPRSFMALLMRASLLERAGRLREAAPAYGDAILQASPNDILDSATRQALEHGRAVNQAYGEEVNAFIRDGIGLTRIDTASARRLDAFIDFTLGRRRRYQQKPLGYYYPGLPTIEFWERDEFPWLAQLEAASDDIAAELASVLKTQSEDFEPYVDYKLSMPLDQWAALNRSRRWGAYHLLQEGRRVDSHADACPRTMAALAAAPQPVVPGRSPAAMFSALEAKTKIPPHTGVANTRLVVHLPLVIPDGCRFRVGAQTRTYTMGQAWVFDDTIEHEAWNDSHESRVILLFDVWNPRLSLWEREMIGEVSNLLDTFNGTIPHHAGL